MRSTDAALTMARANASAPRQFDHAKARRRGEEEEWASGATLLRPRAFFFARSASSRRTNADHTPRDFGEAMMGNWTGFWRYRVGDYRAICRIEDEVVAVFIIEVGHRREIYR